MFEIAFGTKLLIKRHPIATTCKPNYWFESTSEYLNKRAHNKHETWYTQGSCSTTYRWKVYCFAENGCHSIQILTFQRPAVKYYKAVLGQCSVSYTQLAPLGKNAQRRETTAFSMGTHSVLRIGILLSLKKVQSIRKKCSTIVYFSSSLQRSQIINSI